MALLFCTAKVPAKVINELMQECIDADENARGMFYLVRTHDQDCLDDLGTEPPVEDFETSFEGMTDSDLRKYVPKLLKEQEIRHDFRKISGGSIAVLDEKSITQKTVVFHQSHFKDYWESEGHGGGEGEAPNPIVGPAEVTDDDLIWWKWRVPFRMAWDYFIGVSNMSVAYDTIQMFAQPEYQGPDGLLYVETALKANGFDCASADEEANPRNARL